MNLGHAKEPKRLFPAVRSNKTEAKIAVVPANQRWSAPQFVCLFVAKTMSFFSHRDTKRFAEYGTNIA
jgi:hypothetical protein